MVLPRHRSAEANYVVDLTDARAYVVDHDRYASEFDFVDLAKDVRDAHPPLETLVAVTDDETTSVDGCVTFAEMRDERWAEEYGDDVSEIDVDPSEPGVMLLSGGTTGLSKAIPRTHNDYVDDLLGSLVVAGPSHRMRGERFDSELPELIQGAAREFELMISYS